MEGGCSGLGFRLMRVGVQVGGSRGSTDLGIYISPSS